MTMIPARGTSNSLEDTKASIKYVNNKIVVLLYVQGVPEKKL